MLSNHALVIEDEDPERLEFNTGRRETRSLDLSRVRRHFQKQRGRQTDKQFFSQKDISNSYLLLQASSPLFRDMKNAIKSL